MRRGIVRVGPRRSASRVDGCAASRRSQRRARPVGQRDDLRPSAVELSARSGSTSNGSASPRRASAWGREARRAGAAASTASSSDHRSRTCAARGSQRCWSRASPLRAARSRGPKAASGRRLRRARAEVAQALGLHPGVVLLEGRDAHAHDVAGEELGERRRHRRQQVARRHQLDVGVAGAAHAGQHVGKPLDARALEPDGVGQRQPEREPALARPRAVVILDARDPAAPESAYCAFARSAVLLGMRSGSVAVGTQVRSRLRERARVHARLKGWRCGSAPRRSCGARSNRARREALTAPAHGRHCPLDPERAHARLFGWSRRSGCRVHVEVQRRQAERQRVRLPHSTLIARGPSPARRGTGAQRAQIVAREYVPRRNAGLRRPLVERRAVERASAARTRRCRWRGPSRRPRCVGGRLTRSRR